MEVRSYHTFWSLSDLIYSFYMSINLTNANKLILDLTSAELPFWKEKIGYRLAGSARKLGHDEVHVNSRSGCQLRRTILDSRSLLDAIRSE